MTKRGRIECSGQPARTVRAANSSRKETVQFMCWSTTSNLMPEETDRVNQATARSHVRSMSEERIKRVRTSIKSFLYRTESEFAILDYANPNQELVQH